MVSKVDKEIHDIIARKEVNIIKYSQSTDTSRGHTSQKSIRQIKQIQIKNISPYWECWATGKNEKQELAVSLDFMFLALFNNL